MTLSDPCSPCPSHRAPQQKVDWVEVPFQAPAPGWGQHQAGLRAGVEGRSVYEKEKVLSKLRGIIRM